MELTISVVLTFRLLSNVHVEFHVLRNGKLDLCVYVFVLSMMWTSYFYLFLLLLFHVTCEGTRIVTGLVY